MDHNENYKGIAIDVHTWELASGRISFVVYLDGRLMTADIDGIDTAATIEHAMHLAKQHVDRSASS